MLTKILSGITALVVFTTAAFAEEGSIVSVDKDKKQIEVKVGDKTHAVAAASVTLLDAEGNVATLDDFAKDDKVEVTIVEGSVTKIQLAKEDAHLLAGLFGEQGSIVSVDKDKQQIDVKVGDKTHAVAAASVTLLDAEGNVATLDDFAKDDKVEVTIVDGSVTKIQLAK